MSGPVSARAAARRFCERSDWTLTNLELQKMLYLAHMQYMGQTNGSRLMDETFEAWDYGPVSPEVYWYVRDFGRAPIKNIFHGVETISGPIATYLDNAYDALSKRTSSQLVGITHWKDGAWARIYRPGARGIPIPDDEILAEYRRRKAAGQ